MLLVRAAFVAVAAAFAFTGCGGDDQAAGGQGGRGGGGQGGEPQPACNVNAFATLPTPPCRDCLRAHCCEALDTCAADPACTSCLAPDGYCVPPPDSHDALAACVHGSCESECYPEPAVQPDILESFGDLTGGSGTCVTLGEDATCNPMIQSSTCNWAAGAACDVSPRSTFPGAHGFGCFLSHRHHINSACGLVEGMCHYGLTCANYRCARYCCIDADCGANGRCDPAWIDYLFNDSQPFANKVGICVKK